ncbi:MAG: transcriptional regulator [Cyanobacteria bacterium P01_A01_bin.45]
MATEYQFEDRSQSSQSDELSLGMDEHTEILTGMMNMSKRDEQNCLKGNESSVSVNRNISPKVKHNDHFELLSAYIDGEVTAAERKQVEELLAEDIATRKLYQRLFSLRSGLRTLPIPQEQPVEDTVKQVLKRVNRPYRRAMVFGGTAIAACVVGTISGLFISGSRITQMAEGDSTQTISEVAVSPSENSLQVAINVPVFPIPKAANNLSEESSPGLESQDWDIDSEFN